jgi:tetratricopeptide (TPR) repeat protein
LGLYLFEAAKVKSLFKAIVPITQSILFRLALIAAVVLAGPSALMGYLFYTSRPDYLKKKGEESLRQGNLAEAKQIADRLLRNGYNSASHILHGKVFLYQAKAQLERAPLPFPYEGMQRAAQMVSSSAGVTAYPPALRGLGWLSAVQVQQPFPRHIPGVEELLEALAEFTQVLDDDPWAAEATTLASECLVRLGDYRSAELALATQVVRLPDNLDAHRWLAAVYVEVNATTPAAAHLREWIRLDANDPHPYRWLSIITRHTEVGYLEAIEAYRKMLQLSLDPGEQATVLRELAETQVDALADYQQALETLAEMPLGFQDQPSIILLRAECMLGLGNGDEARNVVDEVLKEHPTQTGALLLRAKIYLQDDHPRLAIPLLEKLVSRRPDHLLARQTLMLAYRSIQDEQRAAEQKQFLDDLIVPRERFKELRKVAANEPWNGRARLEIALLNSVTNQSEALAWIRYALAANPEDPKIRKTWTQIVGYQPPPLLREFQVRRQGKIDND